MSNSVCIGLHSPCSSVLFRPARSEAVRPSIRLGCCTNSRTRLAPTARPTLPHNGSERLGPAVATGCSCRGHARAGGRHRVPGDEGGNEALATQALAKEARTDRQLQWRPQLGLMDCWASMDGNGRFHFSIANVVGGPAVGCKAMARVPWDVNSWSLWIVGDVESGPQAAYTQGARRGLSVYSAFAAPDAMAEPRREPDVVLICSDIPGRRYRFPIVDVFPREASNSSNPREMWKPFPPDIYEEGTPDAPPGAAIPCFGLLAALPRSTLGP